MVYPDISFDARLWFVHLWISGFCCLVTAGAPTLSQSLLKRARLNLNLLKTFIFSKLLFCCPGLTPALDAERFRATLIFTFNDLIVRISDSNGNYYN